MAEAGQRTAAEAGPIVRCVYEEVLAELRNSNRQAGVGVWERLVSGRLASPPACEKPVRRRRRAVRDGSSRVASGKERP